VPADHATTPRAGAVARLGVMLAASPEADLATWEPAYGRQAEAQVKWEAMHGRALEVT
jgi:tRNA threonylcarbamoyladenosine biosynthesis protein TsaB